MKYTPSRQVYLYEVQDGCPHIKIYGNHYNIPNNSVIVWPYMHFPDSGSQQMSKLTHNIHMQLSKNFAC